MEITTTMMTGTIKQRTDFVLSLARRGDFGTPEKQNRGSTCRNVFWLVFEGSKEPGYYKGFMSYPYAKAARIYAEELKTK